MSPLQSEEKSLLTVVRDYAVIAWIAMQLILQLWGLAQQTLIASSQAAQKTQQLEQQLQHERMERARAAKPAEEKK